MSARQIARAATSGCLVTISPLVGLPIRGYVCGQDDYHWYVATKVHWSEDLPQMALVHKSAPLVLISPEPTLLTESETFQDAVNRVGSSFWNFCNRYYFTTTRQENLS